jgi:acyl-CoA thioesterase
VADAAPEVPGVFERDTAVTRESESQGASGREVVFAAEVASNWRAGRGPHGGYLAAMLLRALVETVGDPRRAPRSLTIHYARAPNEGSVSITTVLEREGRSLSTLSARMEQDGKLIALVLSAFSVPWAGPEISELEMPAVEPPDAERKPGGLFKLGAPPFTEHMVMQPRLGGVPFQGTAHPMLLGGWVGLAEPRPVDALALAFFCDALIPAPFMRTQAPAPAPTIDLTIHFRAALPRVPDPDPGELCLVRTETKLIQEGFFEEDCLVWAADGTLLAQSRQLAILMPDPIG